MTTQNRRILVVGPPFVNSEKASGGGTGGYTRNMSVYLATLGGDGLDLAPFYHSVRGQHGLVADTLVVRMFRDTLAFLWTVFTERPDAVHILAQYRGALAREFAQVVICRALHIPVGYDVKAGAFVASIANSTPFYRTLLRRLIAGADLVFAEGRETQRVLRDDFGREALFFPNFVPNDDIPLKVAERLRSAVIRLLFVGYAYRGKGIFELVRGVRRAAQAGMSLELTIIGAEDVEFSTWVDALPPQKRLVLHRRGKRPHGDVLAAMEAADVYVFPTDHPGEGHSNSINEAMMYGLVILTSRAGFLVDVLDGGAAYFLDRVDPGEIAAKLQDIAAHRDAARAASRTAREKLLAEFTETIARERFSKVYKQLLDIGTDKVASNPDDGKRADNV